MSRLTIIVAATVSNGIGKNGTMPWHISRDLKYFAQVTSNAPEGTQNAVVMGRNTWESIPVKYRPLKRRLNIVISRNPDYKLNVVASAAATAVGNIQAALDINDTQPATKPIHRRFIIGGASIINEVLNPLSASSSLVDRVLLTRILSPNFECDTFIPDFLASEQWSRSSYADLKSWVGFDVPEGIQTDNGIEYEFQMWTRK